MEDGMALAELLPRETAATVSQALRAYEDLRRQRVADVQLGACQNGLRYDSICTDLKQCDAEIVTHANFRKAIYDYDVLKVLGAER